MTLSQLTAIWLVGENMLDIGMEELYVGPNQLRTIGFNRLWGSLLNGSAPL